MSVVMPPDLETEPHSIEAEQAVLGSLLVDVDAIVGMSEVLTPPAFYDGRHRLIFKAMLGLWRIRRPCDLVTLTALLREKGKLDEAGGAAYLAELATSTYTSVYVGHYAEIVLAHARRRALIAEGQRLVRVGYNTTVDEPDYDNLLVSARRGIAVHEPGEGVVTPIGDQVWTLANKALDRWEGRSVDKRVKLNVHGLDRMTGGMSAGELGILLARTSMGKSALMTHMARRNRAVIFTLEMSAEAMLNRMICQEADVPYDTALRALVDPVNRVRWEDAATTVASLPITIIGSENVKDGLTLDRMTLLMQKAMVDFGAEIGFVDHLGHIHDPRLANKSEYEQTSQLAIGVKRMAQVCQVPIVLLAQLNREVDKRSEKRPTMTDARGSGRIEEVADWLATLFRRQYYVGKGDLPAIADEDYWRADAAEKAIVDLHKNRNGATGEIQMGFLPKSMKFLNMNQAWEVGA